MKSQGEISKRIESIKSTRQITRSMEMVAKTKVQKSLKNLHATDSFYHGYKALMEALYIQNSMDIKHFFDRKPSNGKTAIIAISTDRGLCGGYNANIAKKTIAIAKKRKTVEVTAVGNRLIPTLKKENINISKKYIGISESPIFEEAQLISNGLLEDYISGEISEILVVYTHFKTMLTHDVNVVKLLPFESEMEVPNVAWNFAPRLEIQVEDIVQNYICSAIFYALLQAAASEQSSRVTNMEEASKNSNELIDKLTLEYNRVRQSGITNEITEIISGVEALDK